MTLEAGGAELEPGQAPGKGKTLREPAPCNRGAGGNHTWSAPVWPKRGCRDWGGGLLTPPQVWGRHRKHFWGWDVVGQLKNTGERSAL